MIALPAMPSISFSERLKLPELSGVYIFWDGETVFYVGRARNLRIRIRSHARLKQAARVDGVRIAWQPFPVADLGIQEQTYIAALKPLWNDTRDESGFTSTKINRKTLRLVRAISKRTGEKLYRVFERLAEQETEKKK